VSPSGLGFSNLKSLFKVVDFASSGNKKLSTKSCFAMATTPYSPLLLTQFPNQLGLDGLGEG
jgi:hypothetical protein